MLTRACSRSEVKLYALHVPQLIGIAKDEARTLYQLDAKTGIAVSNRGAGAGGEGLCEKELVAAVERIEDLTDDESIDGEHAGEFIGSILRLHPEECP